MTAIALIPSQADRLPLDYRRGKYGWHDHLVRILCPECRAVIGNVSTIITGNPDDPVSGWVWEWPWGLVAEVTTRGDEVAMVLLEASDTPPVIPLFCATDGWMEVATTAIRRAAKDAPDGPRHTVIHARRRPR